jgi:hypothetical protein
MPTPKRRAKPFRPSLAVSADEYAAMDAAHAEYVARLRRLGFLEPGGPHDPCRHGKLGPTSARLAASRAAREQLRLAQDAIKAV